VYLPCIERVRPSGWGLRLSSLRQDRNSEASYYVFCNIKRGIRLALTTPLVGKTRPGTARLGRASPIWRIRKVEKRIFSAEG
jgi:hypothetical protein